MQGRSQRDLVIRIKYYTIFEQMDSDDLKFTCGISGSGPVYLIPLSPDEMRGGIILMY